MSETTMQLSMGKGKVVEDFKVLMTDVEELLRLGASASGERVDALRGRVQQELEVMKTQLDATRQSALSQGRAMLDCSSEYVKENPWRAIGIGVVCGLLVGAFAAR